jgi:hypothetical protein
MAYFDFLFARRVSSRRIAVITCLEGRLCHLEVVHASDVLDNAVAGVVPDVHAEGEVA